MPQPTQSDVHVDAVLTNISIAYAQDESKFVASKVFPIVPVGKQSDKYFKYTKNDWFRDEALRRAETTESAGSGYTLGTDSYSCDVYAFHKDIGDRTRKNADSPLGAGRDRRRTLPDGSGQDVGIRPERRARKIRTDGTRTDVGSPVAPMIAAGTRRPGFSTKKSFNDGARWVAG